ncbi:hypothetical protein THRCLA_07436 [Thraustotheca clavata]|uniref:Essential protein Yae1 N-terminal domain-containing protein n=1 Tax=Thraustotheca clavata TaxID=74557 RepID=A0A1V9ZD96_9STRA|nr:hypothetical protein THRCLA_07436 [Thraustotheca clavata]
MDTSRINVMSDEDSDGFGDSMNDGDERLWMEMESLAMERRSRTVGFREGIDVGKELTLQEGFNHGYEHGAAKGFRSGVLLGLLRAFKHQFPHSDQYEAVVNKIEQRKTKEEAIILRGDIPETSQEDIDEITSLLSNDVAGVVDLAHYDKKNCISK